MNVVVCVVTALLLLALPGASLAQGRPPVKVGLLLSYTGVLSVQAQDTTRGFELGLAKAGGKAGGRDVQVIKEDTEAKPDVGLTKIKKLLDRDRADFVIGPVSSAVGLAIRNYVHEQGVPLIIPVAFTRALTAPPLASPAMFRLVETTDQSNFSMGSWMMKHTKHRKVIVMSSDFVAGRHSVEAFMAAYRAAGGEVVKEIYAPLGTADFAPYLAQAGSLKADAVYAWFAGADAIRFVKQYREYGLSDRLPLTGYNVLADDTILPAIGDTALGILSVGAYSATIDTPENKAFVRDYHERFRAWPSRYSETGFVAAQLIATVAESLGGDVSDRAKVRDALKRAMTKIKPPRGPMEFDAHQQVITPIYVMKVEKQGSQLVNAIVDRIPAVAQEATWGWWKK